MDGSQMVMFAEQVLEVIESLGSLKSLAACFATAWSSVRICQKCLITNSIHLVINWNSVVGRFLWFCFIFHEDHEET